MATRNIYDSPAELKLIARAKNGDQDAIQSLYLEHSSQINKLCLAIVKDPVAAEDLSQDVFCTLISKVKTFSRKSSLKTWLCKVAINRCLIYRRTMKTKVARTMSISSPIEDSLIEFDIPVNDMSIEGTIDRIQLARAISKLKPLYIDVFKLTDIHGFENKEVASKLGITLSAVKSRLMRARLELQTHLTR